MEREELRTGFDRDAGLYDRMRPTYPEALFADLDELGRLPARASVLEVGCGTGQATRALARRGHRVVCVELGANLAALARRALSGEPSVRVLHGAFESFDAGLERFDAVVAATSWHWIDPKVRYAKAAEVLRRQGALAIISTHHVLPRYGDGFFVEVQDAYASIGERDDPPPRPEDVRDGGDEIARSGLFGPVEVRRYLRENTYSSEEYLALLDTYSGHIAMASGSRRALYDAIRRLIDARGGKVRKHVLFVLHVAPRR